MSELPAKKLSAEKHALRAQRLRHDGGSDAAVLLREPLAIIGMACRFPGAADSPEKLWTVLVDGQDAIGEIPQDRFDAAALHDADTAAPGKMATRFGGFLPRLGDFDADFFGITPREATWMDPQQQLLLEVGWEALERAGIPPTRLAGSRTGVFIGACTNDYGTLHAAALSTLDAYYSTGNAASILANRISFAFDLRGPSLTVDTACSSSLVALHLASQSLRIGESDVALAGGVNVILSPAPFVSFSKWGMMAPDGRCKTFDSRADGFVRAEGCGMVVLKRLADALAAGDPILAVLRGTAVNQGGHTTGLTAPSRIAQEAVLRAALENGDLDAESVGFIETHGTGTILGDPIEVDALLKVYGAPRSAGRPRCALGAIKTNLGHLEAAAGVAGLIKTILVLQHGVVPPNLHLHQLSPHLLLSGTPLFVPTSAQPLGSAAERRFAAVSSFGFGGTNAHVVLESAPARPAATSPSGSTELLVLSARSPQALRELARQYCRLLESPAAPALSTLCAAAAHCRAHHPQRLAICASDVPSVVAALHAFERGEAWAGLYWAPDPVPPRIVLVFPGLGGQWPGMARGLLQSQPVFRDEIEKCSAALMPVLGTSVVDYFQAAARTPAQAPISLLQPALFAFQVALTALWRSFGITAEIVIGHSMGEVAAAYVAGALSLTSAAEIICTRSQLLATISGRGAMLFVAASAATAAQAAAPYASEVAVAAENSPLSTVLSGNTAALSRIAETLRKSGVFCKLVNVDVASHSPQVDSICAELRTRLGAVTPRRALLQMQSTVTGMPVDGEELDGDYWVRNLRQPVLFARALQQLTENAKDLCFLEIGPHPILTTSIEESLELRAGDSSAFLLLPSLRKEEDDRRSLLEGIGALYVRGQEIRFHGLYAPPRGAVPLPTYPWQHQRHFRAPPVSSQGTPEMRSAASEYTGHPLLQERLSLADATLGRVFNGVLDPKQLAYLGEHGVDGLRVVPGAAYLEMALAACADAAPGTAVRHLVFHEPLILPESASRRLQVILRPEPQGAARLSIYSQSCGPGLGDSEFTLHATAVVEPISDPPQRVDPAQLAAQLATAIPSAAFYDELRTHGLAYGPSLQGVRKIRREPASCVALIELPAALRREASQYRIHPALLDACLQPVATLLLTADGKRSEIRYVAAGIHEVRCAAPVGDRVIAVASLVERDAALRADIRLYDPTGLLLVTLHGLLLQPLKAALPVAHLPAWHYEQTWIPAPPARSMPLPRGTWLVILGPQALGSALVEQLRRADAEVCMVVLGASFAAVAPGHFVINGDSADDFTALLRALGTDFFGRCSRVVHLVGCVPRGELPAAALFAAQQLTLQSALRVTQALGQKSRASERVLWLLTSGVFPAANAPPNLVGSPLWGLGRTMAIEYPTCFGGLVDLDFDPVTAGAAEWADVLGVVSSPDDEFQLRLHEKARRVARICAVAPPLAPTWPLPDGPGAYLVTGGLGGLGRLVAAWLLTKKNARHLILVGRTGLPPRREWQQAARAGGELAARIAAVQALEQAGATVYTLVADLGDVQSMCALRRDLDDIGLPLRGVIHAAMAAQPTPLSQIGTAELREAMQAKVVGAWQLHELCADQPLDFFVLFSSIAAVWGAPELGHYAAANHFLDSLAAYRRWHGLPALSINWGTWSSMRLAAEAQRAAFAASGLRPMPADSALSCLDALLAADATQAIVADVHWHKLRQVYESRARRPLFDLVDTLPSAPQQETALGHHLRVVSPTERRRLLFDLVATTAGAVMRRAATDPLPANAGFFELGMDSVMILQLRSALEQKLGLRLPSRVLLAHPTTARLSTYLEELLSRPGTPDRDPAAPPQPELRPPAVAAPTSLSPPAPAPDSESEEELLAALQSSLKNL